MKEFDMVYEQEEINDKWKTVNASITVTITLSEYRYLVAENTRLNYENQRLFEQLSNANMEIEELKNQCPIKN